MERRQTVNKTDQQKRWEETVREIVETPGYALEGVLLEITEQAYVRLWCTHGKPPKRKFMETLEDALRDGLRPLVEAVHDCGCAVQVRLVPREENLAHEQG